MQKKTNYYSNIRWDLIEIIPKGNNKVLEVGCGEGSTGETLKSAGKASEVVGVEKVYEISEIARTKIDKVICADIEKEEITFGRGEFDFIILGDVLEHLIDPWQILNNLKFFLKANGKIIISIPNIRHWRVLKNLLLHGEWKYSEEGILDKTHLRFFTKKSIPELIKRSGLKEVKVVNCLLKKAQKANYFTMGLFEEFLTFKYIVVLEKKRS